MATGEKKPLVLIAADASEHTAKAIDWYIREIHKPEFQVLLINVTEVILDADSVLQIEEDVHINLWQQVAERAEVLKKTLTDKFESHGISDVEARIVEGGRPGEVIVEQAEELGASMVVMGTRGMGTLRRTILGSVSDYVIHHAHCPVLVYRLSPEDDQDSVLSKYTRVGAV